MAVHSFLPALISTTITVNQYLASTVNQKGLDTTSSDRQTDRRGHCQSMSKSCLYFSFMLLIILPNGDKNKIQKKTNTKPLYNCPLAFLKHTFASSPGIINDRGHLWHSSTYFNMCDMYRISHGQLVMETLKMNCLWARNKMKYTINKNHGKWFVCILNDLLIFPSIYEALVEETKETKIRQIYWDLTPIKVPLRQQQCKLV